MPRPKVKKIVTARAAAPALAPEVKDIATKNPRSTRTATVSKSRDDAAPPKRKTTRSAPATRATGTRSTRSRSGRGPQDQSEAPQDDGSQPKSADNVEEDEVAETLVRATPDDAAIEQVQRTPEGSGRANKRPRSGAEETTRQEIDRSSRQLSAEPVQDSQSRIASSPPHQPIAPASAARVHNTPSYMTNFRRQPRQPSILNMVQQDLGLHDDDDDADLTLEGETDLLGEVTTVSKEPEERTAADVEGLYDDDIPIALSSSSRKRKAAELEPDNPDNARYSRTTTPLYHRDATDLPSDPAHLTRTNVDQPNELEDGEDDLTPDDSASRAAVPRSSPPLQLDQQSEGLPSPRAHSRKPRRPGRVLKRRSARAIAAEENPSSSSAISASPPHSTPPSSPVNTTTQRAAAEPKTKSNTRKAAKPSKPITLTTAALQALLPRTRKLKSAERVYDTFDIHSSSSLTELDDDDEIDEDEDELSRPRRRAAAPAAARAQRPGALKSPKAVRGRDAKGKVSKASNKTRPAAATKIAPTKTGRTYTRRSQGDKENEADLAEDDQNEDDSEVTVVDATGNKRVNSGELKEARKKFEEVDEWEMEFESADITGGSSPWR